MQYIVYIIAGLGAGIVTGLAVMLTAFVGAVIGSYSGFLFSQKQPDGLGYISMLTTIILGMKFLIKPVSGGNDAVSETKGKAKTVLAMCMGCGIGWVCGFTGSGGGILMLTVFTVFLSYNLKIAVGTSTLIMSVVALTGTVSHITLGAKLNRIVGFSLMVIGIATVLIKVL